MGLNHIFTKEKCVMERRKMIMTMDTEERGGGSNQIK